MRPSPQTMTAPGPGRRRGAALVVIALWASQLPTHAQTALTLYGLIDDGLRHDSQAAGQKGGAMARGAQTQVLSGTVSNAYFGLRGREALAHGLVARFDLESGFLAHNGARQQRSAYFDRSASLGLGSARLGTLSLGRSTTFAYDQASAGTLDPLQRAYNNVNESALAFGSGKSGAIGTLVSARVNASNTLIGSAFASDRNDNMLKYQRSDGPFSTGLSHAWAGASPGQAHASGAFARFASGSLALAATTQLNVDSAGHRASLFSLGGYRDWRQLRIQAGYQRLNVDDPYNANTTNPLETVDTSGALALAGSTAGSAGASDRIQLGDLALVWSPQANLNLSAVLYHLSLGGSAIKVGANDTLILLAKYALSRRSLVYAGFDASRASGSLRGVNSSGHDVGLSSGVQLKF